MSIFSTRRGTRGGRPFGISARESIARKRRGQRLLETLEDRLLLAFTPIAAPDAAYIAATANIPIPTPDFTSVSSITDGTQTVALSEAMQSYQTVLGDWNSPPAVESATPNELFKTTPSGPITLTLSEPASIFGVEMEWIPFSGSATTITMTADFYEGSTLVGSISRDITQGATGGTLLFAAETDQAFTSVVLTNPDSTNPGIAIAQPRYALAEADLAVTKTVSQPEVNPGGVLTYTIDVTNNGPNDAINPVITDLLPAGSTVYWVDTPGASWNVSGAGTGTLSITNSLLASGTTATFRVVLAVDSAAAVGSIVTETASAASDTLDSDPSNNSDTVNVTVVSPFIFLNGNTLFNQFTVRVDPTDSNYVEFITDGVSFRQWHNTIQTISVFGLEGDDTLTVDNTYGAIASPINFDGGAGANTLGIQGGTATSDIYAPGPGVGNGSSTLVFGGITERITFQNLAPVIDTVAGPLTVVGTPSNDVINYSAATMVGNGLVVVNNFESIEFNSKTSLTLDGGAGDDTITVNNATVPAGLTSLSVTGGIGNDKLVVNALGQPVLSSNITSAAVNIPGATPLPVNYDATIDGVQVVNARGAIAGAVLNIAGTAFSPITNVPVARFNFTDPASPAVLGQASDFAATIDWGDGSTSPGTVVASSGGGFEVIGSHTYATSGNYVVTTSVTDLGSARSFTPNGGVPVVIQDLAAAPLAITPAVGATNAAIKIAKLEASGVAVRGFEGLPIGAFPLLAPPADELVATFMDTGTIDLSGASYSAVINWGDNETLEPVTRLVVVGSPQGVTIAVYATHTYLEAGTYPVGVEIFKTEGVAPNHQTSIAVASSTATIADAPLYHGVQTPIDTTEAALFPVPQFSPMAFSGVVATFNDYNTLSSTAGEFQAVIDWGDGTPMTPGTVVAPLGAPVGTYLVTGSHTYASSGENLGIGQFDIQVFIRDRDGAELVVPNTANVASRLIRLNGILNPDSDSGLDDTDAITNVRRPNFYGTSEPLSHVVLRANGRVVGRTQADSDGNWSITSDRLADGQYAITATATDQFGLTTTDAPVVITPNLLIDTVGPRVMYAGLDRFSGTVFYTFQDVQANGSTPGGSGLLGQSLVDAANYGLNRVHARPAGRFVVTDIDTAPGAAPSSVDVAVRFGDGIHIRDSRVRLKGGYFQVIARAASGQLPAGIQDVAGNALDGEFYGQPNASGNGVAGGDFVANVKSIHRAQSSHGYSGPLTIIGTPHPNSAIGFYPTPIRPPVQRGGTRQPVRQALKPAASQLAAPKHPLLAARAAAAARLARPGR